MDRRYGLFHEDWEPARVALSCHLALDLLCQETQEAWWLCYCCLESPLSQCLEVSPTLEGRCGGRTLSGELLISKEDREGGDDMRPYLLLPFVE